MRVLVSPHSCEHLTLTIFLILATLGSVFGIALWFIMCISMFTNDIEKLLMLIGHLKILFYDLPVQFFGPFLTVGLPIFYLLICRNSLHIIDMNCLSDVGIQNQSSHCGLSFHSQWCANEQKFLILMKSNVSVFAFMLRVFFVMSNVRNFCLPPGYDNSLLCFF